MNNQKIWTENGYTTSKAIEKQTRNLCSYKDDKKVGWYFYQGPCHMFIYDVLSFSRYDHAFRQKQIKVFDSKEHPTPVVIVNGTSDFIYNLMNWRNFLRSEYEAQEESNHGPESGEGPVSPEMAELIESNPYSYYNDAYKIITTELSRPYMSNDSTRSTFASVRESHVCHNCGLQNRRGNISIRQCPSCREFIRPCGILVIHEPTLVDTLFAAIGGSKDCHVLSRNQFVSMMYPLLNRGEFF